MKAPIRFLAMLFSSLLLVVSGERAHASAYGPPSPDTLKVDLSASSVTTNSTTTLTVTVTRRNGTPEADGTIISATVSPPTVGTIAGTGSSGVSSSSSVLSGGIASFVFIAGNTPGTATITFSLPPSNGNPNTVTTKVTIPVTAGTASNPSLQVSPTNVVLPQNKDGVGPYLGSPFMAELKVQWRGLITGQMLNGKINVAISPVEVASFSMLDDPSTDWTGQKENPPTAKGNEFLTLLGSGTVPVTAGIGTIFVHAGSVPGNATLTITATDPETNRTISAQVTINVARLNGGPPTGVTLSQGAGGVYINGGNGPQSKILTAAVTDAGGGAVDDPDAGVNNIRFDIVGPAGNDAKLYTVDANGYPQNGKSVKTATSGGSAFVSFLAGNVQGPVLIRATVDGADGNVDNDIVTAVSATTTVIVSDGQLYSLTITSPVVNAVAVNGVTISPLPGAIPPTPDATYSLTVSAIATDRQGNPVPAGTPIRFGVIDTPQAPNFLSSCNGLGAFQLCGLDGQPQPGAVYFSAPTGHFRTYGGGAGPGDTLVVFGKQRHDAPAGNDDLESALAVTGVVSDTQLFTLFPFNLNNTTGTSTPSGPLLPYVIGRATIGNINSPAYTDSTGRSTLTGTASTTLNYPVSQLNRGVVIWAQGLSTNPQPIGGTRIVTDAIMTVYPSLAEPSISASPNPVPGNISIPVTACVVDALRIPIPGVRLNFTFSNLGAGSGSVDGHSNSGWTDELTNASGCLVAQVETGGIAKAASGTAAGAPTLTFNIPFSTATSASVALPITAGGDLILLATPSVLGGTGGDVILTLLSPTGQPVPGAQLSGACTGDSIGITSGPGVTDENGATGVHIIADLNDYGKAGSGNCVFKTASGSPTVTVNLKGLDLCSGGANKNNPLCPGYVAPKPVPVNVTISSVNGSNATASLSSTPSGVSCSLSNGTTQTCNLTPTEGSYTLTATAVSPSTIVGFTGDCQSSGGNTATLTVPAGSANPPTLTCNVQVSGGAVVAPVKGNITIQSNNSKTAIASISSAPGGVACSMTGLTQTCTNQLSAGTTYNLTGTVSGGSTLVGWAGDCAGSGSTATLAVPATGVSQVNCTLVVNGPGTTATVPVTMTINSDNAQSVVASVTGFANGVSCNIAGTTQTCTPQVDPAASPITLTATITAGKFVGWSGDCSGTTPTATLVVPPGASSLSCTLVISGTQSGLLPVKITLSSANGNAATAFVTSAPAGINQTNCSLAGTTADCTVLLQSGTTYTLTPTVSGGTTFFGWQGDCVPAGGNTATLNMASTRSSFACTLVVNGP